MTDQHPITPPPELFTEWLSEALLQHDAKSGTVAAMVADKAAQWGADQELEACLRLVEIEAGEGAYALARYIRAARRPKPPSLKEQALKLLAKTNEPIMVGTPMYRFNEADVDTLRRAIEALPDD
jgi:hypothetical protein